MHQMYQGQRNVRFWRPKTGAEQEVLHSLKASTVDQSTNWCRDLAESLERVDELQNENQILLTAVRSPAIREAFDSSRHSDVLDILSKVFDTSFARKF